MVFLQRLSNKHTRTQAAIISLNVNIECSYLLCYLNVIYNIDSANSAADPEGNHCWDNVQGDPTVGV